MLDDLRLPNKACKQFEYSGIDSPDLCEDKKHFNNYAFPITYSYNSRGFRDEEWPTDKHDLEQSVWCIGDSFTAGIGSPRNHTWTYLLQHQIETRTINVSMDGASNEWICRRFLDIQKQISPINVVICWSYTHRREKTLDLEYYFLMFNKLYNNVKADTWPDITSFEDFNRLPSNIRNELQSHCKETFYFDQEHNLLYDAISDDEQRRIYHAPTSEDQDFENFVECLTTVEQNKSSTSVVHCVIPYFCPPLLEDQYLKAIANNTKIFTGITKVLDLARDGHHYDILTAKSVAVKISSLL